MWQVQECGIDWNGPVTTEGDNDAATIPSLPLDLINQDHQRSSRIDPDIDPGGPAEGFSESAHKLEEHLQEHDHRS